MEVRCRKCGTVFEARLDEEDLCPICRRFAAGRDVPDMEASDEELEAAKTSNACALHPGNAAAEVCSRCGNFMCSLCVIRVGRNKVCAPCFNMLYGQDKAFVKLASFGERFGAFMLDMLVLFVIWIVVTVVLMSLIFTTGSQGGELYGLLLFLLPIGLWSFYMVGMWAFGGTSLGKKAVGIKIVGPDRKTPSLLRSLARFGMFWISGMAFFIGFLWAAWEKKNRTWHDLVAGTEVIKTRQKPR